jgi:hypothetical protein
MSVEDAIKAYGELSKEVFSHVKPPGSAGRFKASKLEKAIKQIVRAKSASQNPEEGLEDTRDNACRTCVSNTLLEGAKKKFDLGLYVQQLRQTCLSLFYFERITPVIIGPWTVLSGRQAGPPVLPQHSSNRLKLDILAWRKHF